MPIVVVHSENCARHVEGHLKEQVECGQQRLSPTEESCRKDKGLHAKSDAHIKASQAALDYQSSLHAGSVVQQLQNVAEQEQIMNRKVVKSFFRCVHTLSCSSAHSPYN